MPAPLNLTGQRFGKLVVLYKLPTKGPRGLSLWHCRCDCGNEIDTRGVYLTEGKRRSCGCLHAETMAKKRSSYSDRRLRTIFHGMKQRCYNKNYHTYQRYGGRGIFICSEWKTVEDFREWAYSNGYKDNLTIDRIDNDGPYSPENCRWITDKEQKRNTSANRIYKGKPLVVWCEELGLVYNRVKTRLNDHHWPIEEALELKPHKGIRKPK